MDKGFDRGGFQGRGRYGDREGNSDRGGYQGSNRNEESERFERNDRNNGRDGYRNFTQRPYFGPNQRPYDRPRNRPQRPFYPREPYDNNYNNFSSKMDLEEREIMDDEKEFKRKYSSFIDKIENIFYSLVTQEEILKIIKTLIKLPSLTIFEAMNLIYRLVKIYSSLSYYKANHEKKDVKLMSLDGDILENKYPEDYTCGSLNEVIETYKINKKDDKNDILENTSNLYEDEKDRRRKLTKNIDDIYNYLPILSDDPLFINEEDKKIFENLDIFAKNENEINYHPLFFKTMMCHSCENKNDDDLLNIDCPYCHNIQNDFRIIYDYKDKSICLLMKELNDSDLFNFENYLNYIPKKLNFKKIDLKSFKVHKCQLDKSCPNDYHLCPFYHESEKQRDLKRRPPFLFRYSSEICKNCFDENKNKYNAKNCELGDFCNNIHSKNEYNYHLNNFRKLFKCTRNPKGKCPFIKTCYGIHNKEIDNDSDDEEKEESEDSSIDVEKLEDEDLKDIKVKIKKIVEIGNQYRCRKCNQLKPVICFFIDCKHFLCINCLKKMRSNIMKLKKNKNEENKEESKDLKCPFCDKEIAKGKVFKSSYENN